MKSKGSFSVNGKAHRILTRLSTGPATLGELAEVVRGPNQTSEAARGRAYQLMVSIRDSRLARTEREVSYITWQGQDALLGLDHGHPFNRDAQPAATHALYPSSRPIGLETAHHRGEAHD